MRFANIMLKFRFSRIWMIVCLASGHPDNTCIASHIHILFELRYRIGSRSSSNNNNVVRHPQLWVPQPSHTYHCMRAHTHANYLSQWNIHIESIWKNSNVILFRRSWLVAEMISTWNSIQPTFFDTTSQFVTSGGVSFVRFRFSLSSLTFRFHRQISYIRFCDQNRERIRGFRYQEPVSKVIAISLRLWFYSEIEQVWVRALFVVCIYFYFWKRIFRRRYIQLQLVWYN